MWVNRKLTMDDQLDAINKKVNWMWIKLWHLLKKVSVSYRMNLWQILVRPLFEQITMLYYSERSQSSKNQVLLALKGSFKKLIMLKKNTKDEYIEDLMPFNLEYRANTNMVVTKKKWETRVGKQFYSTEDVPDRLEMKRRILPTELSEILNLMTARCPLCPKNTCKPSHLREMHNLIIPDYNSIMNEIERRTVDSKESRLSHRTSLEHVGSFLKLYIDRIKAFLNSNPP